MGGGGGGDQQGFLSQRGNGYATTFYSSGERVRRMTTSMLLVRDVLGGTDYKR